MGAGSFYYLVMETLKQIHIFQNLFSTALHHILMDVF